MRFLTTPPTYDLTYSDVFMVPRRSSVTSRLDVDLRSTHGVGTTIPLVVANMTAVSGRRMAETVARRGGVAIIPQDIPTDVVAEVVDKVKGSHPVFDTPVRVTPYTPVGQAMSPPPKRAHGLVVVVEDGKPLGTLSEADAAGIDRFAQVHEVMSSDVLIVGADGVADGCLHRPQRQPPRGRPGDGRRSPDRRDDPQARAAGPPSTGPPSIRRVG